MKKYSIPIFIPELACPHQCVFCNQDKITGFAKTPSVDEVHEIVEAYLSTIDYTNSSVEIAFFGGNFTGIELELQQKYLSTVQKYIESGKVNGIRLSTRPDYISEPILEILKKYNVKVIELGAQSMDDEVLIKSGRGHKREDIIKASKLIKQYGLKLGLQMMVGLPGDTKEKTITTAEKIIELGADNTRIYPTLVIKGTKLEEFYNSGKYKPLNLNDAVDWSKEVYKNFEAAGIEIIRVGLHPSEGLLNGEELIEGPFHVSFRELVLTEIWNELIEEIKPRSESVIIEVPKSQLNYAVGYKGKNKKHLNEKFKFVKFRTSEKLSKREFNVLYN